MGVSLHAVRLALRAVWWRKGLSLTILLIATLAISAAVVGPMYGRAAEESLLREHLAAADVSQTGVTLTRNSERAPVAPDELLGSVRRAAADRRLDHYFGPAHLALRTQPSAAIRLPGLTRPAAVARLAWRDSQCAALRFVEGRCATGAAEAVLSKPAAAYLHLGVGKPLTIGVGASSQTLRIVGLYEVTDPESSVWFGHNYADAQQAADDGPDRLDTVFVSQQAMLRAGQAGVYADAERPLLLDRVRLDDLQVLADRLTSLRRELAAGPEVVVPTAQLTDVVAQIKDDRKSVTLSALLATVQLVLLTWFVLYLVVANTVEERSDEIALAKLRGLSPTSTASFGLAEPLLLLLLALPLGLLAGFAAAWRMTGAFLLPGTPVTLGPTVTLWALAAAMGAAVAAGLAARALLTRPLLEQLLGEVDQSARIRRPVVIDAMVLVLAGAGVYQLVRTTGGGADPTDGLALLTPGLVALAAGLLGGRVVPVLARSMHRRTRRPRRIGAFLATRHVARRPAALRVVVLVCVAASLATFAVDAWQVAGRNRDHLAAQEVGAAEVIHVAAPSTLRLVQAVRAADPSGRHAMAVAELVPNGGTGPNRVVAVDTERLARVASWVPEWSGVSLAELARRLHAPAPEPVMLEGKAVRLQVRADELPRTPTYLSVHVKADSGRVAVPLGRLRPGVHDYAGSLPPCAGGCRLEDLAVERDLGDFAPAAGRLTVQSVRTDKGTVDAGLGAEGRWSPVRKNLADPTEELPATTGASGSGLQVTFATESSEIPTVAPVDTPALLPVVAVRSAPPTEVPAIKGAALGTALDGAQELTTVVGSVEVLPRAGRQGLLTDLSYAERAAADPDSLVDQQVWLAPGTPASVREALAAGGLRTVRVERQAAVRAALDRQGSALALRLFLAAALASVFLALAAAATMVYVSARHRAYEIAAMRSLGVRSRALVGALTREQWWLLGSGTVLGAAAGVLAAWLALPAYPLAKADGNGPPLALSPAYVAILVLAAIVLALCGAVAHGSARAVVRAGAPDRLREARG
ncbi:MAG TPA: FtsX-like permease family protein [Actinomycetes bacterium]